MIILLFEKKFQLQQSIQQTAGHCLYYFQTCLNLEKYLTATSSEHQSLR